MKHKLAVLLAALLCAGALAPMTTQAIGFNIEIGDRGYYDHGPWYWNHGARWYWYPGHWGWGRYHHRYWVHGHYARR
jgi:hypothetical protein